MQSLPLNIGGRFVWVFGGPYIQKPEGYFGVKLAKEIDLPADVSVPAADFSVPKVEDMNEALVKVCQALVEGRNVYAGCMGGIGRTGLFLAILAKASGVSNPLEYVRRYYHPHAIETQGQYDFLMGFNTEFLSSFFSASTPSVHRGPL